MKKLHSFVFYALVTPAIALGAGSVLAQQTTAQDGARQQGTEMDKDGNQSTPNAAGQSGQDSQRAGQSGSMTETDRNNTRDPSSMQNRGHITSAPANGTQASDLIGAKVRTGADEDIGTVSELIIDEKGQVVAVLVGVGGFLGMGEKDVAIGWDNITLSGTADDKDLRVDVTGDDLRTAPEFAKRK